MVAEQASSTNSPASTRPLRASSSHAEKVRVCHEVKGALSGEIGDIVAKHEEMILHYYDDVQVQAEQSFASAKAISRVGFGVLIATLTYTLIFDALAHFKFDNFTPNVEDTLTVGSIGLVSGLLIEFIAGVNFWLYGRASRQFGAFHICLERTHRYLIGYKIAEKISNTSRDGTLEKLVCIMANAPMITLQDINALSEESKETKSTRVRAVSSEVETT